MAGAAQELDLLAHLALVDVQIAEIGDQPGAGDGVLAAVTEPLALTASTRSNMNRISYRYLRVCAGALLLVITLAGGAAQGEAAVEVEAARAVERVYLPLVVKPGEPPPRIAGCDVFPADNIWNTRVDGLPVHPNSEAYIATIGPEVGVHPDFGSGVWPPGSNSPIGIPFVEVPADQPRVRVDFIWWPDESDPGPYPLPPNAPIEGGPDSDGDRHVLVIQREHCTLYELYYAFPQTDGSWEAANGAVFDLKTHRLRRDGWTSGDAAGLPILPGLVRYDEVASGAIRHALRFTAPETQKAHVWPARHDASDRTGAEYPPMGTRVRLRADYPLAGFSPQVRVILQALKTYGMMLADNGSPWYISGAPDERWDNDVLHQLGQVRGSDFEVVDTSILMIDPDSGQAKAP